MWALCSWQIISAACTDSTDMPFLCCGVNLPSLRDHLPVMRSFTEKSWFQDGLWAIAIHHRWNCWGSIRPPTAYTPPPPSSLPGGAVSCRARKIGKFFRLSQQIFWENSAVRKVVESTGVAY